MRPAVGRPSTTSGTGIEEDFMESLTERLLRSRAPTAAPAWLGPSASCRNAPASLSPDYKGTWQSSAIWIGFYAPLGTIDEEHFDSIVGVNVKGLLFTIQKALPLLPDGASIILSASIVGSKGLAANSVYSATKAAVRSFARTWITDLKARRIRVNASGPGPIDTEGLRELLGSGEARAGWTNESPFRRAYGADG
jgi:NAD(P)-dependent dehydrogenase (short-subunit alcohol dehydrogenase family)